MNREKLLIVGALVAVLIVVFLVAAVRYTDDIQAGPAWPAPPGPSQTGGLSGSMVRQMRGIWLQVHNDDPKCPFEDYIREIAATGANTVCLAVAAEQENGSANVLYLDRNKSPSDERLIGLIRLSQSLDKRVVLMPIVLLSRPAADEWRGKINPPDWDLWWRLYSQYVLHYAELAQENGVDLFMVGSELISTEKQEDRWRELIAKVRRQNQDILDRRFRRHLREAFPSYQARDFHDHLGIADLESFVYAAAGQPAPPTALTEQYERFMAEHRMLLSYSANWDHYTVPKWWDALDAVGMTSYYDLNPLRDADPSVESMVGQWEPIRRAIAEWQAKTGKPIIFTEVGWPSQDGCSTYPWNYYHKPDSPDMLEQQRCMDSFLRVFATQPWVGGVLVWKWRDHPQNQGGASDTTYTPFRKPVMQTIEAFFRSPEPAYASPGEPLDLARPDQTAQPAAMRAGPADHGVSEN